MRNKHHVCIIAVILLLATILCLTRVIYDFMYPTYTRDFRDAEAEASAIQNLRSAYHRDVNELFSHLPLIYVITPTSKSILQVPSILRLGQSLSLVSRVHWVLVYDILVPCEGYNEDTNQRSDAKSPDLLKDTLSTIGLPYTEARRYSTFMEMNNFGRFSHGLELVKSFGEVNSLVMFVGSETALDYRLLDLVRTTQQVSLWPVSLMDVANTVLNPDEIIQGLRHPSVPGQGPRIDLEAVAININHLKETDAVLHHTHPNPAFDLLTQLIIPPTVHLQTLTTRVYMWKTRNVPPDIRELLYMTVADVNRTNILKMKDPLLIDDYLRKYQHAKRRQESGAPN